MEAEIVPAYPVGVLLMEYGEPAHLDEIEPYLTAHYGGRTPPPEMVVMMQQQFQRVWGEQPPVAMPHQIAAALQEELRMRHPDAYQVALGARYWKPSITEQIIALAAGGLHMVLAVPLSAHMSRAALRDYTRTLERAGERCMQPFHITLIEHWNTLPGLLETLSEHTREALERFPPEQRGDVVALFCAHSVPESERKQEDDYQRQLTATATAIAERVGLPTWHLAFHSAQGPGQWLGPDIIAILDTLHAQGVRQVLYVPIGTVYDNVELLDEFDMQAVQRAAELGIAVQRAALPNTDPRFIKALANLVESRVHPPHT